jgi:Zn ribbon nucleic-acid-binding protein
MATLTCPGCGSVTEVESFAKSSEEFCRTCDYPLFWATPPQEWVAANGDTAEVTLRRLPGAGGKQAIATAACPTCNELNAVDAEYCIRCGGPMVLVDEPEPEPEPEEEEPEPEPEPELIEEPEHDWRPWALLLILGLVAVVILVLLLA